MIGASGHPPAPCQRGINAAKGNNAAEIGGGRVAEADGVLTH